MCHYDNEYLNSWIVSVFFLEVYAYADRRNLFYSIMSAMRARDRKTQELKTPMDDLREFPFRAELLFGTSSVQPANKWVVLQAMT